MKTAIASIIISLALTGGAVAALPKGSALDDDKRPTALEEQQRGHQEARGGCGSKGGPGWRKSNGQCASWKD